MAGAAVRAPAARGSGGARRSYAHLNASKATSPIAASIVASHGGVAGACRAAVGESLKLVPLHSPARADLLRTSKSAAFVHGLL